MSNSTLHDLVDIDWLLSHLSDPNIKIIDATWHMPSSMKNAKKDFERRHIPNAVYFDIDDVSKAHQYMENNKNIGKLMLNFE